MSSAPFFSPLDLLVLDQLLAPVDPVESESEEFLGLDVLSLEDDIVIADTKPSSGGCGLPTSIALTSMSVTITAATPRPQPSLPSRRVCGPRRPPVPRCLDTQRVQTKAQRRADYKAHAAQAEKQATRRVKCVERERRLRLRIKQVLHALAAALGRPVDRRLMAFLPASLRAIMQRADAAQVVFRSLTGQSLLRQSINDLPSWW